MPIERVQAYGASLLAAWLGEHYGRAYALREAIEGDVPVVLAEGGGERVAMAMAVAWDAAASPAAEEARRAMEERLDAGNVRGPVLMWVPPRAVVPSSEPEASDFVMRAQLGAASLRPGARAEIDLPVKVKVGKVREEGGYASVIGGLARHWTAITDRVSGTVHVNSLSIRRVTASEGGREALFAQIADAAALLGPGEATEIETVESWRVQRLAEEPLGLTGWAIAQAPPSVDHAEGSVMRPLLRKRLSAAAAAVAGLDAALTCAGLIASYEYSEAENLGAFVKSLSPAAYGGLGAVAAVVDGSVRPVLMPRGR